MSFYTGLQITAAKLLISKGQLVTLKRVRPGSRNATTGVAAQTVTNFTGIPAAIVVFKNNEIDGTKILKSDRKVLMAGTVAVPDPRDLIIVGSDTYAIMDVEAVSPAGTDVIYKIQARRI